MSNLRAGLYGSYYGSFYEESAPLNASQMKVNASYINSALSAQGWTRESIAAILANMQAESTINPGRWQNDNTTSTTAGYGLVQWTPATKYIDWCTAQGYTDPSEMDNALSRIKYEISANLQWIATDAYNMSFSEFTQSTSEPATLAVAFLLNYERPADQSESVQEYRASLAETWYTFLGGGGTTPTNPVTSKTKKRKFNFVLFGKRPWRRQPL